jgi:hypothetical protein
MSQPFQFSMRRMFVGVTLLCAAAGLFMLGQRSRAENYEDAIEFILSPIVAGAGIGSFFQRPMRGAIIGAVFLGLPILCLVVLTWGVCP